MSEHSCHWPGCDREVPPKMWGCKEHWFKLPKILRDKIWKTYVPGQEITKTASPEYIEAAREVRMWIEKYQASVTVDLFGVEIKERFGPDGKPYQVGQSGKRRSPTPRGYGGKPGTGPAGETCGSCKHCYRKKLAKTYLKCEKAAFWTGGRGTDILARTAACNKWEKKNVELSK